MPRDGARTAPLPSADLQFCVRGFLRCRKRQLGFSLKERSKDQRNAGPMPRDRARDVPCPEQNHWRGRVLPSQSGVSAPVSPAGSGDAAQWAASITNRRGSGDRSWTVLTGDQDPLGTNCSGQSRPAPPKSSPWPGNTPQWSQPGPGCRTGARRRKRPGPQKPWAKRRWPQSTPASARRTGAGKPHLADTRKAVHQLVLHSQGDDGQGADLDRVKASWASSGSWVNSRTNSGPATRASTNSRAV